jgi:hypothetical protein
MASKISWRDVPVTSREGSVKGEARLALLREYRDSGEMNAAWPVDQDAFDGPWDDNGPKASGPAPDQIDWAGFDESDKSVTVEGADGALATVTVGAALERGWLTAEEAAARRAPKNVFDEIFADRVRVSAPVGHLPGATSAAERARRLAEEDALVEEADGAELRPAATPPAAPAGYRIYALADIKDATFYEAHDRSNGGWFFEPTDYEGGSGPFSVGHPTREAALDAAHRWAQEQGES